MQAIAQVLVNRGHSVRWLAHESEESYVSKTGAIFVKTVEIARADAVATQRLAKSRTAVQQGRIRLDNRVVSQVADYRRALQGFPADCLVVDVLPDGARALYDLGEIPAYATLGLFPMYMSDTKAPMPCSGAHPPASSISRLLNKKMHDINRYVAFPALISSLINTQRATLGLPSLPYGEPMESIIYSPFQHIQASCPELEYLEPSGLPSNCPRTSFVGPLVRSSPSTVYLPPWWLEVTQHPCVIGITGTADPSSLIIPSIEALSPTKGYLLVVISPFAPVLKKRYLNTPNVHILGYLPDNVLFPHLRLLITNDSYPGIVQALHHKLPVVCGGWTEDEPDTAARVTWVGAGVNLKTGTPTSRQIQNAVTQILHNGSYQRAAAQISAQLSKLGGADGAVSMLVEGISSRGYTNMRV
ncbi:family 1 glycosyltransferase [Thozetella sp. PMI_491]|nr:family 1 glycosyltransferase [Thozetella sp. PMI_491]